MCDKIPLFKSALYSTQLEVEQLTTLLEKCKERNKKKYKCHLIAEQLTNKNRDMEILQSGLEKNIQLCELYQSLDN